MCIHKGVVFPVKVWYKTYVTAKAVHLLLSRGHGVQRGATPPSRALNVVFVDRMYFVKQYLAWRVFPAFGYFVFVGLHCFLDFRVPNVPK